MLVLFGFFIFHVIQMASTVYPRKIALNKHTRTQIVLIVNKLETKAKDNKTIRPDA